MDTYRTCPRTKENGAYPAAAQGGLERISPSGISTSGALGHVVRVKELRSVAAHGPSAAQLPQERLQQRDSTGFVIGVCQVHLCTGRQVYVRSNRSDTTLRLRAFRPPSAETR